MSAKILIIEDESKTAESLRQGLTEEGFSVTVARRGDEGLLLARRGGYELLVLDVMLPKKTGWDVLAGLRESGQPCHVICLTARDAVEDRVRGLELGADDYLVKPFAFPELVARIRRVLDRSRPGEARLIRVADLELDLIRRTGRRRGRTLDLSPTEFSLLALFAERQGQVLSRPIIASEIWGMPLHGESNTIDVAVRRLRRKVDEPFSTSLIQTVRGQGYVLREE